MEMRACEETEMSRDLSSPTAPLAIALYDWFLSSHCSTCFRPIVPSRFAAVDIAGERGIAQEELPPPCPGCQALRYCSVECQNADLDRHASSGECHFFRLVQCDRPEETTDLRAALRLLNSFRNDGWFPPEGKPRRLLFLLTGDREQLEEGCELGLRIREGRRLMSRAREMLRRGMSEGEDVNGRREGDAETEVALWAVLTNGVEVQIGEGRAIGIGVYGPQFSWFNHSCSPNACYRFELRGSECFNSEIGSMVYPSSTDPKDDAMMTSWIQGEGRSNGESCRLAPRVIVRSITPIVKGEQVCITYTDLLQPKASRQSDLRSKYGFICSCLRCNASPETYADRLLSRQVGHETDEQADLLDQVVTEYLSAGNPKLCSEKIEEMLSDGFRTGSLQPFHYLSLKAYMALASMYRAQAPGDTRIDRAAAAYALLLAGTTHHLFLSDPSLIVSTANFWVNAGESFLSLARHSGADWVNMPGFDRIFKHYPPSLPWDEFRGTTSRLLCCIIRVASKVWPDLLVGITCLSEIKSPVDFSWLGQRSTAHKSLGVPDCNSGERRCIGCEFVEEDKDGIEYSQGSVHRLAVHCLVYGAYLGTVCYGPYSDWLNHVLRPLKLPY